MASISTLLQRIDAVPLQGNNLTFELQRWLSTLVDTLNTTLEEIQSSIVQMFTTSDIAQQALPNSGFIPTSSSLTTVTLPTSAEPGDKVAIQGNGSGGWVLQANAGQVIHIDSGATSSGGSLASSNRYDTIMVMCITENTTWSVSYFLSVGGLVVA